MKIDSSQPSFKARCPAVKNAQDVCRAVRNNFSYTAYSKAACEASSDILKNNHIKKFLLNKNNLLIAYREDRKFIKKTFNFYKEVLYSTIHEKVAACYELSVLAEMVLKMNGVKNCGKAGLLANTGEKMNHCVTFVQLTEKFNPKKTIIIDPFLQDADFLPNMLNKYKNQYKKYFKNISADTKLELNFIPERPLEKEEMDFLKTKYPNLLFDRKLFENNIGK